MKNLVQRRPSAAGVIALVALFVALSAGAYAAGLAANSVGTKQLKDGAVTEAKLAKKGALAKGYGHVSYNANDVNPTPALSSTRNVTSVTEANDGLNDVNGVTCVSVSKPFHIAVVTGNDEAGAASPAVFASVNYSPSSGAVTCPAGSDVRVTTYDKLNNQPVAASYSIVLF